MPWRDDETVLGPKQTLTREGFLLAKDVPLARTGTQVYHASELPDLGQRDGYIRVVREPKEVFHPDSIRSFQGRPIVDEHPSYGIVDADNHASHAIGSAINVRRGEGPDSDVLLGDLLFTSRRGIDLVRGGKRAVSVGYDARYDRGTDGVVRQRNIIANHIALVDEGRCGARCSIGDTAATGKGKTMARDQIGPRPDRLDYTSGHVGQGIMGSLVSTQAVGPREVARLRDTNAASLEIYQDGRDAIVVHHGQTSGTGVGMGGRPIPSTNGTREDQPRRNGGNSIIGRGSTTGDAQARAVSRYKAQQALDMARLRTMAANNADFWAPKR